MSRTKCPVNVGAYDDAALDAIAALRALPERLDCGAAIEFINSRLEDLATANAIYGKDTGLNTSYKIDRNNREISWLKDLSLILALHRAVEGEAVTNALQPFAKISLWQDSYPDGPNILMDQRLQGHFAPADVRRARKVIAALSHSNTEDGK